jgi:enoyl-CoA hydratase
VKGCSTASRLAGYPPDRNGTGEKIMNTVTLEKQDKVGILTMNYQRENRFNPEFVTEMMQALDTAEQDDEIRAVVVTGGDPKFFSNGLDLDWLLANINDTNAILAYLQSVNTVFKRWTPYPKPTVAALNGHTFAAGLFMSAHIDFRFMREDRGWICLPEVDINIPLLPGMIAICQATMTVPGFRRLYYTGARLTGPEAVEIGFVERLYPLEELVPAAVEFARMLGQKKTETYAEMKRRIRGDIARILDEVDPKHFGKTLSFSST